MRIVHAFDISHRPEPEEIELQEVNVESVAPLLIHNSKKLLGGYEPLLRSEGDRHTPVNTSLCEAQIQPARIEIEFNAGSDLNFPEKVERANAETNLYPYTPSEQNWGRSDYWESPAEFLKRSGQCQDYAVTKYFLLRAAGVPSEEMRIVVVQDMQTQLAHAVLVANHDGESLLLDNQIPRVTPFESIDRYRPLYALNEQGWWLFKEHSDPH